MYIMVVIWSKTVITPKHEIILENKYCIPLFYIYVTLPIITLYGIFRTQRMK